MPLLKYCPLIWMFCNRTSNNQINKIHKRTLRLASEMEDSNFENLLLKDNSWNVHENNIHTLLIEIYKLMNNLSPQIMKDCLDLKNTLYDLRSKQLLKLPENSTSRYSKQALCFKGSLIWNTIRNKIKNIDNIEDLKDGNLLPAVVNCVCNYSKLQFWFLLYFNLVLLVFIS